MERMDQARENYKLTTHRVLGLFQVLESCLKTYIGRADKSGSDVEKFPLGRLLKIFSTLNANTGLQERLDKVRDSRNHIAHKSLFVGANAPDETKQWTLDQTVAATIAPQGANTWITRSIGIWTGIDERLIETINHKLTTLQYNINVTYLDEFSQPHRYHCEGRYEPALAKFIITSSTSD